MPFFMDRHSIQATPEEIAAAHELDLATQEEYGVKFLTYWFDQEHGEAFCLADAPDGEAVKNVHAHSHGNIPTAVVEVDMDEVRGFLGRTTEPEPGENDPPPYAFIDSAFRVIMFTDMQDSTAMSINLGDREAFQVLATHDTLLRAEIEAQDGRIVKHTGDGFLVAFTQVDQALKSAIAIQQALAAYNPEHADRPIHVRIGLNAGVPVEHNGDLFGMTVQLAARICAQANAGQILATGIIHELCQDPLLLARYREVGRVPAKGFVSAVNLFEIEWRNA
ncbi:MAG: DUF4242 domain-containing protein [Chloroflexota bacterium]